MLLLVVKIVLQILSVVTAYLVCRLDYVTHDKRTRVFKMGRRVVLISFPFFLVGSITILVLDHLDKKREIEMLSQPITNIYVSFHVAIPANHSVFESHRNQLNSLIRESLQPLQLEHQVRAYMLRVTGDTNIPSDPAFQTLRSLLRNMGVRLSVFKNHSSYSRNSDNPDREFRVKTSINDKGKEGKEDVALSYNPGQDYFLFKAHSVHCPPTKQFNNGRVNSIPELMEALTEITLIQDIQERFNDTVTTRNIHSATRAAFAVLIQLNIIILTVGYLILNKRISFLKRLTMKRSDTLFI